MSTAAVQKIIYLSNAWLTRQPLRVFDPSSNSFKVYTAGSATVRFSALPDGSTTITGMGPFALAETSSGSGIWYYVVPNTVVVRLATYVDQLVYQVVEAGAYSEMQNIQPLLVTEGRPPQ